MWFPNTTKPHRQPGQCCPLQLLGQRSSRRGTSGVNLMLPAAASVWWMVPVLKLSVPDLHLLYPRYAKICASRRWWRVCPRIRSILVTAARMRRTICLKTCPRACPTVLPRVPRPPRAKATARPSPPCRPPSPRTSPSLSLRPPRSAAHATAPPTSRATRAPKAILACTITRTKQAPVFQGLRLQVR